VEPYVLGLLRGNTICLEEWVDHFLRERRKRKRKRKIKLIIIESIEILEQIGMIIYYVGVVLFVCN
jgi:hypothetical protein